MYQLSTVLGSLVSSLAGTIEFLYKEASHTSYIVSACRPRAPDSPLAKTANIAVAISPLPATTLAPRARHVYARSSSHRYPEPRGSSSYSPYKSRNAAAKVAKACTYTRHTRRVREHAARKRGCP